VAFYIGQHHFSRQLDLNKQQISYRIINMDVCQVRRVHNMELELSCLTRFSYICLCELYVMYPSTL